jgi:hypothetical protein
LVAKFNAVACVERGDSSLHSEEEEEEEAAAAAAFSKPLVEMDSHRD